MNDTTIPDARELLDALAAVREALDIPTLLRSATSRPVTRSSSSAPGTPQ